MSGDGSKTNSNSNSNDKSGGESLLSEIRKHSRAGSFLDGIDKEMGAPAPTQAAEGNGGSGGSDVGILSKTGAGAKWVWNTTKSVSAVVWRFTKTTTVDGYNKTKDVLSDSPLNANNEDNIYSKTGHGIKWLGSKVKHAYFASYNGIKELVVTSPSKAEEKANRDIRRERVERIASDRIPEMRRQLNINIGDSDREKRNPNNSNTCSPRSESHPATGAEGSGGCAGGDGGGGFWHKTGSAIKWCGRESKNATVGAYRAVTGGRGDAAMDTSIPLYASRPDMLTEMRAAGAIDEVSFEVYTNMQHSTDELVNRLFYYDPVRARGGGGGLAATRSSFGTAIANAYQSVRHYSSDLYRPGCRLLQNFGIAVAHHVAKREVLLFAGGAVSMALASAAVWSCYKLWHRYRAPGRRGRNRVTPSYYENDCHFRVNMRSQVRSGDASPRRPVAALGEGGGGDDEDEDDEVFLSSSSSSQASLKGSVAPPTESHRSRRPTAPPFHSSPSSTASNNCDDDDDDDDCAGRASASNRTSRLSAHVAGVIVEEEDEGVVTIPIGDREGSARALLSLKRHLYEDNK